MEDDLPEGGRDRTLNRLVAMTVVILSVFMAVANIKDDNLVQAMQLAKSDAIDTWSEYQATRTKAHIVETAKAQMTVIAGATPSVEARTALVSMDAELAPFMSGELHIFDMRIVRPKGVIDVAADGRVNWIARTSAPFDVGRVVYHFLDSSPPVVNRMSRTSDSGTTEKSTESWCPW